MWISLRKSNNAPEEMEFLIPSLAMLLAAVAIVFFVYPRVAMPILIGASGFMLAVAVYMHWKQFRVMEYERSTWQNNLRDFAPFVMIGVILLGAYGFYMVNADMNKSPPLISTPLIGGGFDDVIGTAVSRINQLMRKGRIDN
jgi:uncharacterized membrane protein